MELDSKEADQKQRNMKLIKKEFSNTAILSHDTRLNTLARTLGDNALRITLEA